MVVYTPHVCSRVQHLCSSPASPNVVVKALVGDIYLHSLFSAKLQKQECNLDG